ncbi:MAG: transposase [Myxococcales bacterium]|nr:transposase [Myxococcales bacterium]
MRDPGRWRDAGLALIKRVARLIKYYWDGVSNAATTNVTNARSGGLNSKIQRIVFD